MNVVLAEVFPAGEFLADELDARGWTQAEFAAILDRPAQFVSEIISGKKEITRESAAQIGAALGTSAEMWLSLQDQYLLWLQKQDSKSQSDLDDVRRRARLNAKGPIPLLRKAGVLKGKSLDELEDEVVRFFELKSLDLFWPKQRPLHCNLASTCKLMCAMAKPLLKFWHRRPNSVLTCW